MCECLNLAQGAKAAALKCTHSGHSDHSCLPQPTSRVDGCLHTVAVIRRANYRGSSMSLTILLALHITVIINGCSGSKPEAKVSPEDVPFGEAKIGTIVPVADGGAYLTTSNSGLWYTRGSEAIRVHFHSQGTRQAPSNSKTLEIVPSLDGGAYALSRREKAVWYMKEGSAFRVFESTSLTTIRSSLKDRYFAAYIAELRAHRQAEEELAAREEPPESESDYE
jgi:hypothetical protein